MFLPEPFADAAKEIRAVAFSPTGKLLALGGQGTNMPVLALLDVDTGRGVRRLKGHDDGSVISLAFSPDGSMLASGSSIGPVVISHTATGKLLEKIAPRRPVPVNAVAFAPDGHTIAIGNAAGEINLRGTMHRRTVGVIHVATGPIHGLAFSPEGDILASADEDGLRLRDPTTARELKLLAHLAHRSVGFSPDGKFVIAAGPNGVVVHERDGQLARTIEVDGARAVAASRDGVLATASEGSFQLHSLSGEERGRFQGDKGQVFVNVAFAPDGNAVAGCACGDLGGTLYLAEGPF